MPADAVRRGIHDADDQSQDRADPERAAHRPVEAGTTAPTATTAPPPRPGLSVLGLGTSRDRPGCVGVDLREQGVHGEEQRQVGDHAHDRRGDAGEGGRERSVAAQPLDVRRPEEDEHEARDEGHPGGRAVTRARPPPTGRASQGRGRRPGRRRTAPPSPAGPAWSRPGPARAPSRRAPASRRPRRPSVPRRRARRTRRRT